MAKKIIICDDEIHILRAAELKFLRAGYEVRCAGDGEEAWELIQEDRPDLVITDCQMPVLDGIGLASRIHTTPELAGLPVMMVTAKGFELSLEELRDKYGISSLTTKPFSPRALLQQVEDILSRGSSGTLTATHPNSA